MDKYSKGDTPLVFPKFPNEDKMTETEICLACHGCCNYVSVEIEFPKNKETLDHYTWYLHHKNVQIYIDNDNAWNLLFITPCVQLQPNGMCSIYETRPNLCREYSAKSCSRTGKDHKFLFETPDAMLDYLKELKEKKKKAKKK
ncbi:MAG: YkgJ family cysteine cluster protein [Leptospiraceae bacterium]|nr:YkgJ family cysteine cluster protein [Leptospiraceae bacterium]MCK6380337.1 YkgJ family cysteine cluster protein [Leptospiraceae bacterium]NUM41267.1 YkgJ family cysteine cluster protein [Leptospiraceae bacterium]